MGSISDDFRSGDPVVAPGERGMATAVESPGIAGRGAFEGQVVLVTGASTGIGRATAIAFARAGARLVLGDIDPRAADTASVIESAGGDALFVPTDVRDPESVRALVDAAVRVHGRLDAAFNNAGILPPTAELGDMSVDDFDLAIAIDLRGVFLCIKHEINAMLKNGGGAIVNTASVAGVVAGQGMAAYVAAKHGVIGLTKAAAMDYAARNVRVNAVAPGLVSTPMTERWLADPVLAARRLQSNAMGRAAQPEEIAGTVLHLCSAAASFVTGQTFIVDGGQTAQ